MSTGDTRTLTHQIATRRGNLSRGVQVRITGFGESRKHAVAYVDTPKGAMTIRVTTLAARSTDAPAGDAGRGALLDLAVSRRWT